MNHNKTLADIIESEFGIEAAHSLLRGGVGALAKALAAKGVTAQQVKALNARITAEKAMRDEFDVRAIGRAARQHTQKSSEQVAREAAAAQYAEKALRARIDETFAKDVSSFPMPGPQKPFQIAPEDEQYDPALLMMGMRFPRSRR